jgi:hypothetical protein
MPKLYRVDEQPVDAEDIRKILLSCNNRRLKSYLLILASGAMRARELLERLCCYLWPYFLQNFPWLP